MPGLIQRTEERIRENVIEQVGSKDATTAGNKQRGPVLLEKHRVSEKMGCHVVKLVLNGFRVASAMQAVQLYLWRKKTTRLKAELGKVRYSVPSTSSLT